MDNNLKRIRAQVALEAYAVTDLPGLVSRIIPTVKSSLSSFKGMFTPAPAVALNTNQKDFLKSVASRTYPSLMPLSAFVPEGMKTTYLDYSLPLLNSVIHVEGCVRIIDEFAVFLSMLVTNKEAILETATRERYFATLLKTREQVNADVQKCFDGSTRTDRKVEDVIKRNADWPKVTEMIDAATKLINKVERSHLNKKVEECVELIEKITKMVHEGHFDKVSPGILLDLSDGAYQVAEELEFYAVTYYRLQAFTHAVDRTMEHIQKVTSRDGVTA